MPKSSVRKKKVYTPPTELQPHPTVAAARRPSPVWVPALAVTLIVFGIGWLVVYYLTQGFADIPAATALFELQYWNLAIGFVPLIVSLLLLSKWR